ncbi:hypothetical protein FPQ18DRAFT_259595 [Pyronema domesticum]|nr:hypothetical protein FPQ18DRAFT_259595 [Pyronema domesticum]
MLTENPDYLWDYTPTVHSTVYPSLDPTLFSLPSNFTVLITGAGRGVGRGIALAYAKAGAGGIIITSRTMEELEKVEREMKAVGKRGLKVVRIRYDVKSEEQAKGVAERIWREFGRLDCLVNNAGMLPKPERIGESPCSTLETCVQTNMIGPYFLTHHCLPLLLSSEAGAKAVVSITSVGAMTVLKGFTGYATTKLGLLRMAEIMQREWQDKGLLAYTVHPGSVKTKLSEDGLPELMSIFGDSSDLSGAFVVWLTKQRREWLTSRFLSANWDVDELEAMKEGILERDALKMRMVR